MKRMILCVGLSLALLAGCSTTVDTELSPSQSLIAELSIRASTVELINHDVDTAKKVIDIATETLLLVDSGSVTVIDVLDDRIRDRIDELNLTPEKEIIADMLLVTVRAEIEHRIGSKVLNPDTVVTIATVLKIMVDTAERYQ